MLKRALQLSGLAVVALVVTAALTGMTPPPREVVKELLGSRPAEMNRIAALTNGVPVYIGTLVSGAGATINNATTAAPFVLATLCPSRVLQVDCDLASQVGIQATCSATITNAAYAPTQAAHQNPRQSYILRDTDTNICASGGGALNCAVFCMN